MSQACYQHIKYSKDYLLSTIKSFHLTENGQNNKLLSIALAQQSEIATEEEQPEYRDAYFFSMVLIFYPVRRRPSGHVLHHRNPKPNKQHRKYDANGNHPF